MKAIDEIGDALLKNFREAAEIAVEKKEAYEDAGKELASARKDLDNVIEAMVSADELPIVVDGWVIDYHPKMHMAVNPTYRVRKANII